mgnify:CR=1 FL=1
MKPEKLMQYRTVHLVIQVIQSFCFQCCVVTDIIIYKDTRVIVIDMQRGCMLIMH